MKKNFCVFFSILILCFVNLKAGIVSQNGTVIDLGTNGSIKFSSNLSNNNAIITANSTSQLTGSFTITSAGDGKVKIGNSDYKGIYNIASPTSQTVSGTYSIDQNVIPFNLALNSGTVTQNISSARFGSGVTPTGTGTYNVNNQKLERGGTSSANITFTNAKDLTLYDNYTLSGATETYSGNGTYSLLNGNGYTYTMTAGATIAVDANHTLYITDMRLKGLGGAVGFFTINSTGKIVLSNVTIDLSGNFTLGVGEIWVYNDCKIIARGYTFTVNSTGKLKVDGDAFLYEPLDSSNPTTPFSFAVEANNLQLANNGVIRSAKASGGESALTISTTPYTLTSNVRATSTSALSFTNASPGTPKPMTLDGGGYYIQFPATSTSNLILLETNVQLTLTNIVLKDFDPVSVTYGAASSKIIFGENCRIQLARDVTIGSGDRAFEFVLPLNNAYLDAGGHTLTLDGANRLTLAGSGINAGKIVLENCTVETKNAAAFSSSHYEGVFELKNSKLLMDQNGFTFALGNLFFSGKSELIGKNTTTVAGSSTFTLSSTGSVKLLSKATLEISPDTTFIYQPTILPGNSESAADQKKHFKFTDPSSTLILNGCNLTCATPGIHWAYGKVLAYNKVNITAATSSGNEFELGSSVDLQIMGGALLSVDGWLKYVSTSFP